MDRVEEQKPAVPPPGPTSKNKIAMWLTFVAVGIVTISLLFSNGGTSSSKNKVFSGKQQPASLNEIDEFQAQQAAEAERARKQAQALQQTQKQLADIMHQASDSESTTPPCQETKQGCYGYQPQVQTGISTADAARAERQARQERRLRSSSLVLDLPGDTSSVPAASSVAVNSSDVKIEKKDSPANPSPTETVPDKKTQVASFDVWNGKLYRIFEGMFFEVVIKNRINGDAAGPVEAMLTNDLYSMSGQHLLLPKGTVFIGEARAVTGQFQQRLFVGFHRLICPDGFSVNLDQFRGLTQKGEVGLQDQVNRHYVSIFGTAIALGVIGGVSNIGNGSTGLTYDPTVQFRSGIASEMSQAADRILDRFLNRLPTLVIREGARSRIFVSQDLLIPAYADHRMDPSL